MLVGNNWAFIHVVHGQFYPVRGIFVWIKIWSMVPPQLDNCMFNSSKCQRNYSSMGFMCIMWCIFVTLAC